MRNATALLFSLLVSFSLFAATPTQRVEVPSTGKAPVIDGKITSLEWKGAAHVSLGKNGYALLLHDENFLYVGLVSAKPGVGSLCVQGRTGVRVLHASAALGTAAYEEENGKWRMTRGFTFTNRDTGNSPEALADRKKMLSTEGWFANTSVTAMPEREYQIPARGKKEMPLVLSFVTYTPDEQKVFYWPATIADDCGDVELTSGFTEREYSFDPKRWGVAVLK
jgi:hypothetical protein